ncbi:MAG: glycosyltransferase family 4 protein, partial [Ktedonobacteraceae bacterium]
MPIKKRILFIHLGYAFGGIEVYMQRLAQLLAEDAEVFAICSHPELQEGLEAQGVRVSSIPMIKGMLRPLRFLALLIMLPVWIIRNRIDVVHINGYWESILLLPARLCGAKAISTRHLTYDIQLRHWYEAPKRTLASLIYNANARFANEVTCVSEAVATEVRTIVNPNRVSVIPNWMDDIPDYRVRTVDVSRPIRLLFVGR